VTITPLPTVPGTNTPPPSPRPVPTPTDTAETPDIKPDPSGYLVVDMLPAPARCMGVASSAKSKASFHRDGTGLVIDLVVTLATGGTQSATFTGASATAWSAQGVSSTFRSGSTIALVRIRPSGTSLGVSLAVSCGAAGVGTLAVNVSYTAPASESTPVSLSLHDY